MCIELLWHDSAGALTILLACEKHTFFVYLQAQSMVPMQVLCTVGCNWPLITMYAGTDVIMLIKSYTHLHGNTLSDITSWAYIPEICPESIVNQATI